MTDQQKHVRVVGGRVERLLRLTCGLFLSSLFLVFSIKFLSESRLAAVPLALISLGFTIWFGKMVLDRWRDI